MKLHILGVWQNAHKIYRHTSEALTLLKSCHVFITITIFLISVVGQKQVRITALDSAWLRE